MALYLPKRWVGDQAPKWPLRFNPNSIFAKGVLAWVPTINWGGTLRDLSPRGNHPTTALVPGDFFATKRGNWAWRNTTSTGAKNISFPSFGLSGTQPLTVAIRCGRKTIAPTSLEWILGQGSEVVLRVTENLEIEFILNSFSSNDRVISATNTFELNNEIHDIIGTYDGSQLKLSYNGLVKASVTPTGSYADPGTNWVFPVDFSGSGNTAFRGDYEEVLIANEAWTDAQIAAWSNPTTRWDLYAPRRTFVAVPAAAGGGETLTAEKGSYELTGNAAALHWNRLLTADQGTYTLAGKEAALTRHIRLEAGQGVYALTGNDSAPRWNHHLEAVIGGYTLTGNDATLTRRVQLTADPGNYTITGQAAALLVGHHLEAGQGFYVLTGQAAALHWNHALTAELGSYALSGLDATLTKGFVLVAEQGSYILTGQTADLRVHHLLTAEAGGYTLTGLDATLREPGEFLTADPGSYTLTGQAANLLHGRVLTAEAGALTLTGQDAALRWNRRLVAEPGSFTLTGQDASLLLGHRLAAEPGAYVLTGNAASLLLHRLLTGEAGSYTLSGLAATLTVTSANTLIAETGTYILTGRAATLTAPAAPGIGGNYTTTRQVQAPQEFQF